MVTDAEIDALVARARYEGPPVARDQLIGVDACLRQLGGQLTLFSRPELGQRFGLEPSGTLLIGPPGTGKTLVARYLASELGLPFYQVSADEFGSDPELLHGFFRRLSGERAIAFVDEVSILALRRQFAGDLEARRMLAALLTSLDGVADDRGRLWVIGACTADIQLDPAIHRSGRLGVVIEFEPPSEEQRRALFRLYLGPVPNAVDEGTIERLAEASVGATGADIRDWVSQAASEVLAEADTPEPVIEVRHLEAVVARRGFIAADRPGREPDWETATHEAGHAVLALGLFGSEALSRASVGFWRRADLGGEVLGQTVLSDDWRRDHPPTSATWPDHAAFSLAGVTAEQVILGYRGSGATADVRSATEIILDQLEAADPEFGPSRRAVESSTDFPSSVVGSEAMRTHAWVLLRNRFAEVWRRTLEYVEESRPSIETVARALLERKATLTGDEIVAELGIRRKARR
ncbi:MAG TPA: AAA family ATPase [Candidatus Limnocylindrales bacterium]